MRKKPECKCRKMSGKGVRTGMPCTLSLDVSFLGFLKLSFPPPCAPAGGQGLCCVLGVRKRGHAQRVAGGRAGAGHGTAFPMLRV